MKYLLLTLLLIISVLPVYGNDENFYWKNERGNTNVEKNLKKMFKDYITDLEFEQKYKNIYFCSNKEDIWKYLNSDLSIKCTYRLLNKLAIKRMFYDLENSSKRMLLENSKKCNKHSKYHLNEYNYKKFYKTTKNLNFFFSNQRYRQKKLFEDLKQFSNCFSNPNASYKEKRKIILTKIILAIWSNWKETNIIEHETVNFKKEYYKLLLDNQIWNKSNPYILENKDYPDLSRFYLSFTKTDNDKLFQYIKIISTIKNFYKTGKRHNSYIKTIKNKDKVKLEEIVTTKTKQEIQKAIIWEQKFKRTNDPFDFAVSIIDLSNSISKKIHLEYVFDLEIWNIIENFDRKKFTIKEIKEIAIASIYILKEEMKFSDKEIAEYLWKMIFYIKWIE